MRPLILFAILLLVLSGCGEKSSDQPSQPTAAANTSVAQTASVAAPQMISSVTIEERSSDQSTPVARSASELYLKCASCHGANGEKSALGKSQVIARWDAQKITDAILGYQNGTYGGSMKALMSAQVKSLSREEIQALARYISAL